MKTFGELLHHYRLNTIDPKTNREFTLERMVDLLYEEIGYLPSPSSLSYWENDRYQIGKDNRSLLLAFIKIFHLHGEMRTLAQANEFLESGNYRDLSLEEARSISMEWAKARMERAVFRGGIVPQAGNIFWPPNIPNDPYYSLPNRDQEMARVLSLLQNNPEKTCIVIDGLGGLGKTAFGVEAARRALQTGLFEGIVGDSAKQEVLAGSDVVLVRKATLDFHSLMDTIANQLKMWEIISLKSEEKYYALIQFFKEHPYLLFVDNLETAENAHLIVNKLLNFLNGTRAIITTRKKVSFDQLESIPLGGLSMDDALLFIRQVAEKNGVLQIVHADRTRLEQIVEICGGAPLAIKLVVSQGEYLDVDIVLDNLKHAGTNLYAFIYRKSWEQLSPTARKLLIYIGKTVVTTVSWEELEMIAITEDRAELVMALDQLVGFSLVNVHSGNRYGIHQLTRQFVTSDLPRMW